MITFKELDEIIQAAADYEDGELGMNGCIEHYCQDNDISDEICWQAQIRAFTQGALSAGIPIPVIQGKRTLRDYFSQDYINFKCNKDK
jgi:hypothetical protein